jgi:3-phenylpropionate/trans-cinnamate dioxygenase ferredoxin reductase subunit
MNEHSTVIIGAGLAGATAAETLRSDGYGGRITIIGQEEHEPYLRPPLSKGYLAGAEGEDALVVKPSDWYRDQSIELRLGVPVVAIDRENALVRCADGRSLGYDRLLIATGASSRRLPLQGADLPGVYSLRTVEESRRLQSILRQDGAGRPRRLVLIGSGWIGMEVAATARTLGADVTVLGPDEIPLSAAIGPELGSVFQQRHQEAGVRFLMREQVAAIVGREGRAAEVVLHSGTRVPADAVVVAVGAEPNVELAIRAGLAVERGIRVGDTLRTTDPKIWAAGDVANVYQPSLGRYQRYEHWASAIATGRRAARSMLGLPVGEEEIPYFYTDQFDLGMEYWGQPALAATARLVLRGDPASRAFVAFWVAEDSPTTGTVVAGMHVNEWDAPEEIRQLIRSRRRVDLTELASKARAA